MNDLVTFILAPLFYILFALTSFYILFGFGKHQFKAKVWQMIVPPLCIIPPILIMGLIVKWIGIEWDRTLANLFLSIMLSSGVLLVAIFVKSLVPLMFDTVINFHQTYNSENLDKNPVKFFIKNKNKLILAFYCATFFANLLMLYGIFWGDLR